MPKKMKLDTAYRFGGRTYGPSYDEAIEVPDEVAEAAGYTAEIPESDAAAEDTPADDPNRDGRAGKSRK